MANPNVRYGRKTRKLVNKAKDLKKPQKGRPFYHKTYLIQCACLYSWI